MVLTGSSSTHRSAMTSRPYGRSALTTSSGSYTETWPMKTPWNVADLEIVGYADVLKPSMLPSVVPPVFRVTAEAGRALAPPYSFSGGFLYDATEVSHAELEEL